MYFVEFTVYALCSRQYRLAYVSKLMQSNLCKNDLTWLTNNLDVFCRGILIATSFVRSVTVTMKTWMS